MPPELEPGFLIALAALVAGPLLSIRMKWLSPAAALHAGIFGLLVLGSGGPVWLVPPALFLAAGSLFARDGAEKKAGRRPLQVWANGGVYAGCLVLHGLLPGGDWQVAALAAMAAAAADTAASAAGIRFGKRPRSILTLKPVPAGYDGGITAAGLLASAVAAGFMAVAALLLFTVPYPMALLITGGGFLGSVMDSYLGALFQHDKNRFSLSNDGVNLLSTAGSAVLIKVFLVYGMV